MLREGENTLNVTVFDTYSTFSQTEEHGGNDA